MRILLLDNSSLTPRDNDFFVDAKTGEFAKELKDLGNDITFYGQAVLSDNTSHCYPLKSNGFIIAGVKRRKNKLWNYFLLYLKVIPFILRSEFVYIFYPSALGYVAIICWIFQRPYGIYLRGENGVESKISQWIYKKARTILTVNDFFTQMVNRFLKEGQAISIRPMISYTEQDLVIGRSYKNPKNFNLLYLGRFDKEKGIGELLLAVKRLKTNNFNFELNLVGDGSYMTEAKMLIIELEIEDIVHIKGSIFDVDVIKNHYCEADIYILPTYHEGFPRTLYEAMIFGTPIITSFVGGISALMKDGYNCKEIKPKSIDSIVEVLSFAMTNYEQMGEYARNGTLTISEVVNDKRISHAHHLNMLIKAH